MAESAGQAKLLEGVARLFGSFTTGTCGAPLDRPSGIVDIVAPVSGVITDQQVTNAAGVQGLSASANPFTISDLSYVWILCDVYENDLPTVRLGDSADVRLNAFPDRVVTGRISNIGAVLDPNIRTAKVRIEVNADRIPLSRALVDLGGDSPEARSDAATCGDDYEIAFTVPRAKRDEVLAAAQRTKTQVTEIGRVVKGAGAVLLDDGGREILLAKKGFTHF